MTVSTVYQVPLSGPAALDTAPTTEPSEAPTTPTIPTVPTVADLQADLAQAHEEHKRFREQVRTLAIVTAQEQGWCTPGLNEGLRSLGLAETTEKFRVHVTYEVTGTPSDSEPSEEWVKSSLEQIDGGSAASISLDHDWDDVTIEVVETTVSGLGHIA